MNNIDPTFPLIDLHRHLDGSVRAETILELGLQHNIDLPAFELDALCPHVEVTEPQPGLLAFFEKFKWQVAILVDYDACRRIAYENVKNAKAEGIDYIELRFSPWFMAETHGLDPAGVVEAVVDGVQSGARDFGVATNLIGIMSRTYGVEICHKELDALLTKRDDIVALDLAGDEVGFPAKLFTEHFARGRDAGWQVTVHAGEADGPDSVWQAINEIGATRIGHGFRAIEDPRLVAHLAREQIGLEISLTSNVQISAVTDYASHPLTKLIDAGVLTTLNTDDPGVSGIDLPHEYNVAAPQAGLSTGQIRQLQRNALELAFLSADEKELLCKAA